MCYNCSGGYTAPANLSAAGNADYSPLEATVQYTPVMRSSEEAAAKQPEAVIERKDYSRNAAVYTEGMYLSSRTRQNQNIYFAPDVFLKDIPTEFISSGDEEQNRFIMSLVESAFEAATGKTLQKDIAVRVCSEEEMKKFHEANNGRWTPEIRGFSINRRGFGTSEVFVKEDELAKLMLTMGHELGHVITLPMNDPIDEEAKAFAFSMAWMNAIKENNIGSLSTVINPRPARNGLHNVAFDFVLRLIENGRKAIDVYLELIKGEVSINNTVHVY